MTQLRTPAEVARCAAMRSWMKSLGLVSCIPLAGLVAPGRARADDRAATPNAFAFELGGVRHGFVRAAVGGAGVAPGRRELVLTPHELTPSLVGLVAGFARGAKLHADIRLTSGAVVRRASDARLVSTRFPALGSGGAADLELRFDVAAITTQPLLSTRQAAAAAHGGPRIVGFRVALDGMPAIEAPKLDAVTVGRRPDGSATTGAIGLDVAAGGGPRFVTWQSAHRRKASPRALHVQYVGADGATLLELHLDRCTPTAVNPMGASGTTRVTLACTSVRGG